MVFPSGKKSYRYPKPLTKICVTLIMPNVLIGKKIKNVKNEYIYIYKERQQSQTLKSCR